MVFKDTHSFRFTNLSRRVLFFILVCSSSVTLLLTLLELYLEYRVDVNLLEQRFESIKISYLPSLSENIWLFNTEVIQSQILGICNLNDITYVTITDDAGSVIYAVGEKQQNYAVTRIYPLIREQGDVVNQLGFIEIGATLDNIYLGLWNRLAVTLVGQGIKTFLVSFLILLVIFKIVTFRVSKITQLVQEIDLSDISRENKSVSIHSAIQTSNRPHDELDDLALTIDSMYCKVKQLYLESDEQRSKLQSVFEGSHDAIFIIELENNEVVDFNSKAHEILGFDKLQLKNQSFATLYSDNHIHISDFLDEVQRVGWGIRELIFQSEKNGLIPTESSASVIEIDHKQHILMTCRDIRERKLQEAKIDRIINFDQLTGLPNRLLMRDRISQMVLRSELSGTKFAVLIVDIDNFKAINDTLGQGIGDLLIKATANIIQSRMTVNDSLGRLSADEFLLLTELNTSVDDVAKAMTAALAEKIRSAFTDSLQVASSKVKISVSIGCSMLAGDNFDDLIKYSDLALCKAKADGRDRVVFFHPGMDAEATQKLALTTALHEAYKNKEFLLYYQPIVDLATGKTVSVECLIRWKTADGKLVSPAEFIPELVRSGLIMDVGAWVIEEACTVMAKRAEQGNQVPIAVNVSPCQLESDDIINHIVAVLSKTGLDPQMLVLEITEDLIVQDKGWAIERLSRLSEMGIKIALDDFGTGYSSLSYLKILPVDKLKIDQSFVRDMLNDPEDSAIVATIISIAHILKLELIAEGVETEEQATHLKHLGCTNVQGYLYKRPQEDLDESIDFCSQPVFH